MGHCFPFWTTRGSSGISSLKRGVETENWGPDQPTRTCSQSTVMLCSVVVGMKSFCFQFQIFKIVTGTHMQVYTLCIVYARTNSVHKVCLYQQSHIHKHRHISVFSCGHTHKLVAGYSAYNCSSYSCIWQRVYGVSCDICQAQVKNRLL